MLPPHLEGSYATYLGELWAVHDYSACVNRYLLFRQQEVVWANAEEVQLNY